MESIFLGQLANFSFKQKSEAKTSPPLIGTVVHRTKSGSATCQSIVGVLKGLEVKNAF